MVRVYTNIEDASLTKLAKYMFFIEISIYFLTVQEEAIENLQPRLGETFDAMNVYIQDLNSKDYNLQNELDKTDNKMFIYHILVDTRNPRFDEALSVIKNNNYFIDCYQCKDKDSNKAIIRMRTVVKNRIPLLVNSEYSKMYKENEFDMLLRNRVLQQRYTIWNQKSESSIHSSLQILMKTKDMLDTIIDKVLGDSASDEMIDLIASREFDSKYSIEKESINSLNLN